MIDVHIRDLGIIDETPKNRFEASVVANNKAILVSIDGIKCIIRDTDVLVFCPDDKPARIFLTTFKKVLTAISENDVIYLQSHGFSASNLHDDTKFEVIMECMSYIYVCVYVCTYVCMYCSTLLLRFCCYVRVHS